MKTIRIAGKPHIQGYTDNNDVVVRCWKCTQVFHVDANRDELKRWASGEHAQMVWPQLSTDDRELLISGTCGKCWSNLFKPEDQ